MGRAPTRAEHALGITLAVTVTVLWVASSEVIQHIFKQTDFNKPYFLTYLTSSSFCVLLAGFLRRSWRELLYAPSARDRVTSSYAPVSGIPAPGGTVGVGNKYNVRDVARVSAIVGPLYFAANYSFNAGLALTSVSSSSTISNLSSLFTLAIGACTGVEKFSWGKLSASLITIAGVAAISGVDSRRRGHLLGDALSVLAAFLFGCYITTLKASAPEAGAMDMGMFWALIGLILSTVGWIPLPILHATGVEKFSLPSRETLAYLVANALIGSVLSDFLWAKSVVLTSALVGTITLSLTIPLALMYDAAFKQMKVTPAYIAGVVLVISGFILVNLELSFQRKRQVEAGDLEGDDEVVLSMNPENTSEEDEEGLEF